MARLFYKLVILVSFILIPISSIFGQDTFSDTFSSVSYGNNDGTQNFSGNWNESGDDNSPSGGYIRITANELRFRGVYINTYL